MQTVTTLEQSKRLLELGIDLNTADMIMFDGGDSMVMPYIRAVEMDLFNVKHPAWSLSALLDLLPTPIFYKNSRQASMQIIRAHDGKSWHISYDFKPDAVSIGGKTLIDAAVRTLEYINDRQNRIRIGIND